MTFAIYAGGLILIAAVSWTVASPFFRAAPAEPVRKSPARSRWEARRDEALAGIRDAELDFHVGKLSEEDYRDMRARLETQAMEAIHGIEEDAGDSDDR